MAASSSGAERHLPPSCSATPRDYRVRLYHVGKIKRHAHDSVGALHSIDWKVVTFDNDDVYIQAREIVMNLIARRDQDGGSSYFDVGHFMAQNSYFRSTFDFFDLPQDTFLPSARMATGEKWKHMSGERSDPRIRQEMQLSPYGVLAMLLDMILNRRLRLERERAFLSMVLFAQASSVDADSALAMVAKALASAGRSCNEDVGDEGRCCHMQACGFQVAYDARNTPSHFYVSDIVALARWDGAICSGISKVLRSMFETLADRLARLANDGKFVCDLKKEAHLKDGPHKRRIDEDYKIDIVDGTVKKGTAKSGRQAVRCNEDGVNPKSVADWEIASLNGYRIACARDLTSKTGTFHIVEDGIRVGDPAEETWFQSLLHPRSGLAVVLPPMVPRPSPHYSCASSQ